MNLRIGISPDENDGGFYYAPRVQYSVGSIDIVAAYRGANVDGGSSFDIITLGVEFGL